MLMFKRAIRRVLRVYFGMGCISVYSWSERPLEALKMNLCLL